jgi:hypothetical protein
MVGSRLQPRFWTNACPVSGSPSSPAPVSRGLAVGLVMCARDVLENDLDARLDDSHHADDEDEG